MLNKRLVFGLLVLAGLVFTACQKKEDPFTYSPCVQVIIDSLSSQPVFSPPARIEEWVVGSDTYIYTTSSCCDQLNYLLNLECEVTCSPDGGFSGMGDGNCPDLKDAVKMLIWEDPR